MMHSASEEEFQILPHPQIADVLLLPVDGPRYVRNAAMSDKPASAVWSSNLASVQPLSFGFLMLQYT